MRRSRATQTDDEAATGQEEVSMGEVAEEEICVRPRAQERREAWLRAPEWMPRHLIQPHEVEDTGAADQEMGWRRSSGAARASGTMRSRGHAIVLAGPMAFCAKCARFARHRLGTGLRGECPAPQHKTANSVAARLSRLRQGLHPLTGVPLDTR